MTTFQRFALLFFFGFFFAVGCVLSFTIGRHTAPKCEIIQTDTVFVTTTTHYDNPEPSDVLPAGFELIRVGTVAQLKQTIASLEEAVEAATVAAEARDSTQAEPPVDSAQVEIPLLIERKIYGGKEGDEYRAVVSGIFPKLESLDIYRKTEYITNTVVQTDPPRRKARVGLGVTAGPGVYWTGSGIQPGLGATVGLTLTF